MLVKQLITNYAFWFMQKQANKWKKLSFLMRAKNRQTVLKTLLAPQTPASIQKKTKLSLNTTSRALRELNKEKLVVCKTPRLKVGRIYIITNSGKKALEQISEMEK